MLIVLPFKLFMYPLQSWCPTCQLCLRDLIISQQRTVKIYPKQSLGSGSFSKDWRGRTLTWAFSVALEGSRKNVEEAQWHDDLCPHKPTRFFV